jgi:hypothetical protein
MGRKVTIATASNVLVPAYLVLRGKGYRITRVVEKKVETWRAVKPGVEFIAEDPLSLLGLVSLYEARGEAWRAEDAEIDDFCRQFP